MRILLCPVNRQGSGRFRIGLPASVLQKTEPGLEIYLSEGLPCKIDVATGKAVGLADEFEGWDAVVVQHPMADWQVVALRACRVRGIRTVVEIDDDFEALHHLAPAWASTHPRSPTPWNRQHLREACREADLVVTTTQVLADRYASHGRVAIIPNYIPEAWLSIEEPRDGDVVGWTGTVATHQGDLAVTRGGVAWAIRETRARFRVIGQPEQVKQILALDGPVEHVPWQDWDRYPHAVARLDVGIAPLANTAFNRAKSGLKPLEMAALGVPCVMSPLPSYAPLPALGIGVIAEDRSRTWRRTIKELLQNDSYRADMSAMGRETAATWTVEANAWRFGEAWAGSIPRDPYLAGFLPYRKQVA